MPRIPKQPGCDCHVPVSASEDIKLKILESNFDQKLLTKQDKLEAGTNIKIDSANNKIYGILTETITTNVTVGGVKAGSTLTAGTSLDEILKNIFKTQAVTVDVYTKIVDAIPETVAGFDKNTVEKSKLLSTGYVYKDITTNDQYAVLAIPKAAKLKCYEIKVNGFSVSFNENDLTEYYLYYLSERTSETTQRYTYLFEEE